MIGHPEPTTVINCPVCALSGARQWPVTGDSQKVACDRCGQFEIADSAAKVLSSHPSLRDTASQLINQLPRPATGWLLITSYMLHELFPMELGSVDG